MQFNRKEAWKSVCVIARGDTIHQASPTIIRMHLPNRELRTIDAENASVFGPQLHRVFNNHRPIDWPIIEKMKQRDLMEELDHSTSW